ncbi:hypothetical protein RR46_13248 [Papilio xuthus]|uniref:Uncharacterized protein n=1 Tax=Papilio xuthus TaxID=66420 RepID=A0A194PM73_PAPXU|nr:hypothetical protein RR46_13248 [Papilio xuthus]
MGQTEEQRPSPRRSPALPAPPALPALPPPIQPYSGFLGNISYGDGKHRCNLHMSTNPYWASVVNYGQVTPNLW